MMQAQWLQSTIQGMFWVLLLMGYIWEERKELWWFRMIFFLIFLFSLENIYL